MDSILQKGGGGTGSDECTATKAMVLAGYKAVTADSGDEAEEGTLDVQSILDFSCAPYSAKAITFAWQNPAKGAFSGVIIVGKEGGYPENINDGTRYYKGYGDNAAAGGVSSVVVDDFSAKTTYYFRTFSYAVKENEEWLHTKTYTGISETYSDYIVYTESGIFVVPPNVHHMDVFLVGGGSSGKGRTASASVNKSGGAGGGSGYTKTILNISPTSGQSIPVVIGHGGQAAQGNTMNGGGTTKFGDYEALGGSVNNSSLSDGSNGGSGGGAGGYYYWNAGIYATGTNGGTNGSDGVTGYSKGGKGQGATTRAFGESTGTLYAGGGGGGGANYGTGSGGAGGGGGGDGGDATRNTGGGGGGGYGYGGNGGKGGDGIAIIRITFK